jgi:hypothetical protein
VSRNRCTRELLDGFYLAIHDVEWLGGGRDPAVEIGSRNLPATSLLQDFPVLYNEIRWVQGLVWQPTVILVLSGCFRTSRYSEHEGHLESVTRPASSSSNSDRSPGRIHLSSRLSLREATSHPRVLSLAGAGLAFGRGSDGATLGFDDIGQVLA